MLFRSVDTNSDPSTVDYVIPANDDASKSIELILDTVVAAMAEGLEERKVEKADNAAAEAQAEGAAAPRRERRRIRKNEDKGSAPAAEVEASAEAAE